MKGPSVVNRPRSEELWLDLEQRQENFSAVEMSRPALGPTKPPVQRVLEAVSRVYNGRDVKLSMLLHLVLSLSMSGTAEPLPHTSL
jgi:hypothetical protein